MDGSLYKTNCDFEKPIPQNIWIEDILVLDFLGCATSTSKRACILTQLAWQYRLKPFLKQTVLSTSPSSTVGWSPSNQPGYVVPHVPVTCGHLVAIVIPGMFRKRYQPVLRFLSHFAFCELCLRTSLSSSCRTVWTWHMSTKWWKIEWIKPKIFVVQ